MGKGCIGMGEGEMGEGCMGMGERGMGMGSMGMREEEMGKGCSGMREGDMGGRRYEEGYVSLQVQPNLVTHVMNVSCRFTLLRKALKVPLPK